MDLLIFIGIFLIIAVSGIMMKKAHDHAEKERQFEMANPLSGMPIISTEPHFLTKNNSIKYSESVTGSAIMEQPLRSALMAKWDTFFNNNPYKKQMRKVAKQAVFNMKRSAKHANLIVNTRVQTSVIKSPNLLEPDKICAVAYGVAITYY